MSKKSDLEPLIKPNNDISANTGGKVDFCFLDCSSVSRASYLGNDGTYQVQFNANLKGGILQITLGIHSSTEQIA